MRRVSLPRGNQRMVLFPISLVLQPQRERTDFQVVDHPCGLPRISLKDYPGKRSSHSCLLGLSRYEQLVVVIDYLLQGCKTSVMIEAALLMGEESFEW